MRSALNAFPMFIKTGAVRDGEVVWRLDEPTLQAEQEAQAAVSYDPDPSLVGLAGLPAWRGAATQLLLPSGLTPATPACLCLQKANRTRAKPLSGAQRRKLKKAAQVESGGEGGEEGEGEGEEAGEEGAHEALAAMMSSQVRASWQLQAVGR